MIKAFVAPSRSRRDARHRVLWVLPVAIAALLALTPVVPVGAQGVVSPGPSVTVTGTGEATAPAATATVQPLIGQRGRDFEFSQDGSDSGQQSSFFDSSYGGLGITVPVFDPSAAAEVEVYAVLTISYGIVESEQA